MSYRRFTRLLAGWPLVCLAVAACDQVTGVTVMIDAGKPIDRGCIDKLPDYLGPVDRFVKLKVPQPDASEEFEIARNGGWVYLGRTFNTSEMIRLSFSWMGPGSRQRESAHITLLDDVQNAILRACGLERDHTRITRSCGGDDICRNPALKDAREN
jgi:hypothetical protein